MASFELCTWMWLRPTSCSPAWKCLPVLRDLEGTGLLHMALGGAVFAGPNGCSTEGFLCLVPLKGKKMLASSGRQQYYFAAVTYTLMQSYLLSLSGGLGTIVLPALSVKR